MLNRAVALLIGALLIISGARAWTHGGGTTAYQGPCDVITSGCSEAYSVTRAMTINYTGPLFQLYNGTTTLNVGQINHQVDLSTWSAFCSGVQANCKIATIYAQINSANNLIPSIFNLFPAPNCSGGGAYKCAAPFTLASDNSLPIIMTTSTEKAQYTIADDASATGVTSGHGPTGVVYVGKPLLTQTYCCGVFGLAHKYNAADINGTDFMVMLAYGNSAFTACGATYCAGIDEEFAVDLATYSSSLIANAAVFITLGTTGTKISVWINNHILFNQTTPSSTAGTINSGGSVHLGGGGDLTQATTTMREGFITNTTLSSGDQSSALANITSFYNGLSFP